MSFKLPIREVCGTLIPLFFDPECFQSALQYKPRKGDVFVATYPKCGTTWMQNVVLNIFRRGETLEKPKDFFLASPFLDMLGAEDAQKAMIRPGVFKTHLPFNKVPWSDDAQYIYVARNPKDCAISLYHHMLALPAYQFDDGSFEDFFDCFLKGEVEYGDYFDHLIGWYSQRQKRNVFFITFEEMKMDLAGAVMKVADFLGSSHAEFLRGNDKVFRSILQNCSITNMKAFINKGYSDLYHLNPETAKSDTSLPKGRKYMFLCERPLTKEVGHVEFIRDGAVKKWETWFSKEQDEKFNEVIREKTSGTNVMNLWKDLNLL